MTIVHLVVGLAVMGLNLAAGVWGAWCWYRVRPSRVFWVLARAGQAALVVEVLLGGLLLALGEEPASDLHLLYGLLPIPIALIAEQLRIVSAEHVLHARGLESAQAVGKLPEAEQRSVVLSIVRREIGVMALAALAIGGLALRAGFVSPAL